MLYCKVQNYTNVRIEGFGLDQTKIIGDHFNLGQFSLQKDGYPYFLTYRYNGSIGYYGSGDATRWELSTPTKNIQWSQIEHDLEDIFNASSELLVGGISGDLFFRQYKISKLSLSEFFQAGISFSHYFDSSKCDFVRFSNVPKRNLPRNTFKGARIQVEHDHNKYHQYDNLLIQKK